MAWPFLFCQKPMVAASPLPRAIFGGWGVNFTLAEQADEQPAGETSRDHGTITTDLWDNVHVVAD